MTIAGYLHRGYAESLREFGTPRELSCSKGWIIERQIPGFPFIDAMGCYPLFCCQEWSQLHRDLDELADLVSLTVVTDPFGKCDESYLKLCFPDLMRPFKQHYVIDLQLDPERFVAASHRKAARRALRKLRVEGSDNPAKMLGTWINLFNFLIERHKIRGISAFSKEAFSMQLEVPGIIAYQVIDDQSQTVGMELEFIQGDIAYAHLAAFTPAGYRLGASYALDWAIILDLRDRGLRWRDIGGSAGVSPEIYSGLAQYKQGWSTGTRIAYLCGRIFDIDNYKKMAMFKGASEAYYFPAYRAGEFEIYPGAGSSYVPNRGSCF
jgi:hypothetical protein